MVSLKYFTAILAVYLTLPILVIVTLALIESPLLIPAFAILAVLIGALIVRGIDLTDKMLEKFYDVKWISLSDLSKKDKKLAKIVEEICTTGNWKTLPKIGIAQDDSPYVLHYGTKDNTELTFLPNIHPNQRLVFTTAAFTKWTSEKLESETQTILEKFKTQQVNGA